MSPELILIKVKQNSLRHQLRVAETKYFMIRTKSNRDKVEVLRLLVSVFENDKLN